MKMNLPYDRQGAKRVFFNVLCVEKYAAGAARGQVSRFKGRLQVFSLNYGATTIFCLQKLAQGLR